MSQGESFFRKDDTITQESFNDANNDESGFGIVLKPVQPVCIVQVFHHENKPGINQESPAQIPGQIRNSINFGKETIYILNLPGLPKLDAGTMTLPVELPPKPKSPEPVSMIPRPKLRQEPAPASPVKVTNFGEEALEILNLPGMPRKEVVTMTDDSLSMIFAEANEVTEAMKTIICENMSFEDYSLQGTPKKDNACNATPVMLSKKSQTVEEEVDHFANLPNHKRTQTEKMAADLGQWSVYFEIESKNPDMANEENKDSPTRKARAMATKKDPMQEFFTLTFQSIKMNGQHIPATDKTKAEELYPLVQAQGIMFNSWTDWIVRHFKDKYNRLADKSEQTDPWEPEPVNIAPPIPMPPTLSQVKAGSIELKGRSRPGSSYAESAFGDDEESKGGRRNARKAAMRKDPMTEYFAMTAQSIKMDPANIMKKFNVESFYTKVQESKIPFNKWHAWIHEEMAKI